MLSTYKASTNLIFLKQLWRSSILRTFTTTRLQSDYYKTLGVRTNATMEDIDKAYFEKVKFNMGLDSQENVKLLEAYETLVDEARRKDYDEKHLNSVKLDNLEELVHNASDAYEYRSQHPNSPIAVAQGLNANNSKQAKELNPDQIKFIGKVIWITFLLITVPKLAYLGYIYFKGDTFH